MALNDIIILVIAIFAVIGGLDKILGNRFGLGKHFEEGFMAMGPLALAMIGIISLSPVIAQVLTPLIAPAYGLIGADPASFANTLLAIDMGGYNLAEEMGASADAALFSWVFLGTMMGPTIVFTIPVALGMIEKSDQPFFAKGILIGVMTVPVGCLIGGIVANLSIMMMLKNLIIPIVLSILIAIGLWRAPDQMTKGFIGFGKGVEGLAIIGLIAITFETLTDITLIPNMLPLSEGVLIVGKIAIFLAGAFPMVNFISTVFKRPLEKIGQVFGANRTAMSGWIASLAHSIPMFSVMKYMNSKGKVINVAFAVSGAFVFGSHLGFVAGIEKEMVLAMVVGKLIGGLSAVLIVLLIYRGDEIEA